jgi:hypothetical protein
MRICKYANNFVNMAHLRTMITTKEIVYIRNRTKGAEYTPLFGWGLFPIPDEIALPFYYQNWHRKLYLVIDYEDNFFFINRNPPAPDFVLLLW